MATISIKTQVRFLSMSFVHIVSSKVNYVRALLVRIQNVAQISKSRRKIWSSWQIFGYMQANKSYFIHLDPSTQSAILSKQLVSMFEIIGMADKNLIPKDFFLNCKYLLLPITKHLVIWRIHLSCHRSKVRC